MGDRHGDAKAEPEQRLNGRRSQVCSAPDDSDFFR
jgi:hypothetical protein